MPRLGQVTDSPTAGGVLVPATGGVEKRDRLISAARTTFHERGVGQTTLALVAQAAGVPAGNVYYYFKTKDELVSAVLTAYDSDYAMLEELLSRHESPRARLKALIQALTSARERITLHGCPIGSLCSELDKRDDDIAHRGAQVFAKLIDVAQGQFEQLGRPDARELAIALIAAYEGIALIANTLRDPELISSEALRLERWIDSL